MFVSVHLCCKIPIHRRANLDRLVRRSVRVAVSSYLKGKVKKHSDVVSILSTMPVKMQDVRNW